MLERLKNLHSTMFLLNPPVCIKKAPVKLHLYSTMFLLNLPHLMGLPLPDLHLHSTMFLLNRIFKAWRRSL